MFPICHPCFMMLLCSFVSRPTVPSPLSSYKSYPCLKTQLKPFLLHKASVHHRLNNHYFIRTPIPLVTMFIHLKKKQNFCQSLERPQTCSQFPSRHLMNSGAAQESGAKVKKLPLKKRSVISSLTRQNLEFGIHQGKDPGCLSVLIFDKWHGILF